MTDRVASLPNGEESASAHSPAGSVEPNPPSSGRFDGRTPSEEAEVESPTGHAPRAERQAINYCPYCSEETLFPLQGGGWECRSCRRAFSVTFRGLVAPDGTKDLR